MQDAIKSTKVFWSLGTRHAPEQNETWPRMHVDFRKYDQNSINLTKIQYSKYLTESLSKKVSMHCLSNKACALVGEGL